MRNNVRDTTMAKKYTTASTLIYISAIIGIINSLMSFNVFNKQDWIISLLSISIVVIIGLLTSRGYAWVKYLLLVLILIGLSDISYIVQDLKEYPINGLLSLSISILQIVATIILFLKRKDSID